MRKYKRQADAGKRARDADHAQLIEIIGVRVVDMIVMMGHEFDLLQAPFAFMIQTNGAYLAPVTGRFLVVV